MKTPLFLVLIFYSLFSFSQKETNIWYFGNNAGLDFNSGAPVVLTNSAMSQYEGVASIADANGQLLFYSDGVTVWNSVHVPMPNGSNLAGHSSATQSALIMQQPGSTTRYYIFTVGAVGSSNGFNYSIIDMTLNGGLGDVSVKNILIHSTTTEKLTGAAHSNNTDAWVVMHDRANNNFHTYAITPSGFNSTPVITSIGPVISGLDEQGYMKISPDGTRLAMVAEGANKIWLFDFDNSNGNLSNAIMLNSASSYTYGTEFSPNSKVLYGTAGPGSYMLQWDLSFTTAAGINASMYTLTPNLMGATYLGALSNAPDKKMYFVRDPCPYIGAINFPDVIGAGCTVVDSAVYLLGNQCRLGLPNMYPSLFDIQFTFTQTCLGDSTYFDPGDTTGVNSFQWNFGDPASGINNTSTLIYPAHLFTTAGVFSVKLLKNYSTRTDTLINTVTINQQPHVDLGNDTSICNGDTLLLHAGPGFPDYLWQDGTVDSVFYADASGNFSVTVTNGNCTSSDSILININPCIFPSVNFISSQNNLCYNSCVDFTDLTTNSPLSWQWSFPGGNPAFSTLQNPAGICYNSSGAFDITLIACNVSGCDTLQLANALIVYPEIVFTPIYQNGDTLFATQGFALYQWYHNTTLINGANNYYHIADQNGDYSIIITDANGCSVAAMMLGVIADVNDLVVNDQQINAYYGNGLLSINCLSDYPDFGMLKLYDVTGKIVFSDKPFLNKSENKLQLSVPLLSKGVYFISLLQSNKLFMKKIIVH